MNLLEDISDFYSYERDRKKGGWDSLNYLLDKKVVNDLNEVCRTGDSI